MRTSRRQRGQDNLGDVQRTPVLFFGLSGFLLLQRVGPALHCREWASHCGVQTSVVAVCGLSSCGTWAQLFQSMWYLPRPGFEPVSPALAGRLLTMDHQGSSTPVLFNTPASAEWALSIASFCCCYTKNVTHLWEELWGKKNPWLQQTHHMLVNLLHCVTPVVFHGPVTGSRLLVRKESFV